MANEGLTQYVNQAKRVGKDLKNIGSEIESVEKTLTATVTNCKRTRCSSRFIK